MTEIVALIEQTRAWRKQHSMNGRRIEAAACAIREKALTDALKAIGGTAPQEAA